MTPEEIAYENGKRFMSQMLLAAIAQADPSSEPALPRLERIATISMLRRICERFGDNDWPDNLHLVDILEKHLERHLIDARKR